MPTILQNTQNDENQGNMDTALSTQSPIIQNQAQQEPVTLGAQQSATVQNGATTVAASPQNKPNKGTGFTNVQQYVQANKGAAQQIANAASSRLQSRANTIKGQVEKATQGFNTQAQQSRERISQASQFGQTAINTAKSGYDIADLNKQKEELNKRISQTTVPQEDYQQDTAAAQSNLQTLQAQQQKATADRQAALASAQNTQTQLQQYQTAANAPTTRFYGGGAEIRDEQNQARASYNDLMTKMPAISAERDRTETIAKGIDSQMDQANQQMEKIQFNKKLQERNVQLQQELAGLQAKVASNQELTPEEVTRFRNIVEEREIFDNIRYEDRGAEGRAKVLQESTGLAGSEVGRRQLLRDTFAGGNKQYTRGQTALDQLLLQGDRPVAEQFISQTKQLGTATSKQAQDARRAALQELGRVSTEASNLRTGLAKGVTDAQTGITADVQGAQASGAGSYLSKLKQAYEDGLLSQEQAERLGLQQGQAYGVDIAGKLADYKGLSTAESAASKSDLVRAQALAKLAGQQEQTIFANADQVGELSQAEKARLGEIQGSVSDAQKEYNRRLAEAQSTREGALRYSGESQRISGAAPNSQVTNLRNSQNVLGAISRAQADGTISEQDLYDIQSFAAIDPTSRDPLGRNMGVGDFGRYYQYNTDLANLQNQNLENRLQVEGSTESLVAKQQQDAINAAKQQQDILRALGLASYEYGGQSVMSRGTRAANEAEFARQRTLQAMGDPNYRVQDNDPRETAMNLIEAYNKISGRNFNPNR